MCIIAVKKAGIAMPDSKVLDEMFWNNNDGAGFMYLHEGMVHIRKGYMKFLDFSNAIKDIDNDIGLKDRPVIMHFRIGTHGKNVPENTHPFPVSENLHALQKTRLRTDIGVAHNGIIYGTYPQKGESDTMAYIRTQMALIKKIEPNFILNDTALRLIHNAVDSKMAFLDRHGHIAMIGDFVEEDGIMYSNSSYKPRLDYRYNDTSTSYGGYLAHQPIMRKAMLLSDKDGYILLKNKTMVDADGYLLGEGNIVYTTFDYSKMFYVPGAYALTHANTPMKFDPADADYFELGSWSELRKEYGRYDETSVD